MSQAFRADEHAPEEYRESMLKNVRLRREIVEAWAEHGEQQGAGP